MLNFPNRLFLCQKSSDPSLRLTLSNPLRSERTRSCCSFSLLTAVCSFFPPIGQPDLHLITRAIRSTCQVRKTASPSGPYNAVRSVEVQPSVELIEVVIYRRRWQAKSFGEGCGSVTRPEVTQCNIFMLKSANAVMEQHFFFLLFFF